MVAAHRSWLAVTANCLFPPDMIWSENQELAAFCGGQCRGIIYAVAIWRLSLGLIEDKEWVVGRGVSGCTEGRFFFFFTQYTCVLNTRWISARSNCPKMDGMSRRLFGGDACVQFPPQPKNPSLVWFVPISVWQFNDGDGRLFQKPARFMHFDTPKVSQFGRVFLTLICPAPDKAFLRYQAMSAQYVLLNTTSCGRYNLLAAQELQITAP